MIIFVRITDISLDDTIAVSTIMVEVCGAHCARILRSIDGAIYTTSNQRINYIEYTISINSYHFIPFCPSLSGRLNNIKCEYQIGIISDANS